jgi:uncharacterized protein with PQ loop repeat
MRYLQNYKQHNEGIKSTLAGIGLAGSLLAGSPDVKALPTSDTSLVQMQTIPMDGTQVNNMVTKLSDIRKQNCQDQQLNAILDEIKMNVNNQDPQKMNEMFGKLSSHLETEYGYKVGAQTIDQLSPEKAEAMKDKPTESNFFFLMGWLGSICLALCGVPQAIQSWQDKHSHGISWGMLLLWAFGECFALTYVFNKLDMPMIMNYGINIFVVGMMLYFKIYPKKSESPSIEEDSQ